MVVLLLFKSVREIPPTLLYCPVEAIFKSIFFALHRGDKATFACAQDKDKATAVGIRNPTSSWDAARCSDWLLCGPGPMCDKKG